LSHSHPFLGSQAEEERRRAGRREGERKSGTRRRSIRIAAGASVFFLSLILWLAFLRSTQIAFVFSLFVCILFGGISVCLYMILSIPDATGGASSRQVSDTSISPSNDVLTSLNVYVKYALRGSETSRREIARLLNNVLRKEDYPSKETGRPADSLFQRDLERVVYAYTSSESVRKKPPRKEREAYLASLERIIKRLEGATTSKSSGKDFE
jgi:hypothetical protein